MNYFKLHAVVDISYKEREKQLIDMKKRCNDGQLKHKVSNCYHHHKILYQFINSYQTNFKENRRKFSEMRKKERLS